MTAAPPHPAQDGTAPAPAAADLRTVLGRLPTGVVVVTGVVDGAAVGVALNSFTSVSLAPPLVSFAMARTSTTWPVLRRAGRWAVSVLGADQEDLCRRFATRGADRFAGLDTAPAPGGAPVLAGSTAWLDCRPSAVHPAGDHDLVLAEVLDLGTGDRRGGRPGRTPGVPPGRVLGTATPAELSRAPRVGAPAAEPEDGVRPTGPARVRCPSWEGTTRPSPTRRCWPR